MCLQSTPWSCEPVQTASAVDWTTYASVGHRWDVTLVFKQKPQGFLGPLKVKDWHMNGMLRHKTMRECVHDRNICDWQVANLSQHSFCSLTSPTQSFCLGLMQMLILERKTNLLSLSCFLFFFCDTSPLLTQLKHHSDSFCISSTIAATSLCV